MNPFSQYGKPFSNQRISSGFQPTHSPLHHPIARTDTPNTPPSFNSLGFQPTRMLDPGPSQRVSSPNEAYNVPNKRVRHTQEVYTEVFPEGTTQNNQGKSPAKMEEQGQQAGGRKDSDEGFIPGNTAFRKVQSNYGYNMQENSGLGSNQALNNAAQLMALRQYLNRYRKEGQLRDNTQGQIPMSFQNDPLYSMLANNMGLTNLLSNSAINSLNPPLTLELLRQMETQQTMQLLGQQLQMNQQLLYNLQDPTKGAPNSRNNNTADSVSPSTMRIPPLNIQNLMEYLSTSSLPANSVGAFLRSEIRDKLQLKNSNSEEEFQKPVSNQTAETNIKSGKPTEASPNKDQKENKPPGQQYESGETKMKQDNMVNNIVIQSLQEKKIPMQAEAPSTEIRPQRKKSASIMQKETFLAMDQKNKERGERRKNKWQMMIENTEESVSNDSPSEASTKKVIRGANQPGKASLRVSSAFRKLKVKGDDIYEDEFSDTKDRKKHRIESSSQRKKKNAKQQQNKDLFLFESEAIKQPAFEFPVEDSNRLSIASSFGRSADEFVLDEKDQKIMETRVGKEYQVRILDLDLNLINLAGGSKRTVNLAWEPEMFDREALEAYFAKLQSVLSCNEVNEEKAIKMLIKKNMVPEEVIVTVKKNEKFYSSFLGSSHALRHVKNKKNPEDRK